MATPPAANLKIEPLLSKSVVIGDIFHSPYKCRGISPRHKFYSLTSFRACLFRLFFHRFKVPDELFVFKKKLHQISRPNSSCFRITRVMNAEQFTRPGEFLRRVQQIFAAIRRRAREQFSIDKLGKRESQRVERFISGLAAINPRKFYVMLFFNRTHFPASSVDNRFDPDAQALEVITTDFSKQRNLTKG